MLPYSGGAGGGGGGGGGGGVCGWVGGMGRLVHEVLHEVGSDPRTSLAVCLLFYRKYCVL